MSQQARWSPPHTPEGYWDLSVRTPEKWREWQCLSCHVIRHTVYATEVVQTIIHPFCATLCCYVGLSLISAESAIRLAKTLLLKDWTIWFLQSSSSHFLQPHFRTFNFLVHVCISFPHFVLYSLLHTFTYTVYLTSLLQLQIKFAIHYIKFKIMNSPLYTRI